MSSVYKGLAGLAGASLLVGVLGLFSDGLHIGPYNIVLITTFLFWATQATSWNLLSGYAGYFSFGQGAFLGVGVYTTAVMTGRHGVNFLLTVPIGGALAGLLALLVGAIAFRLRSLRGEIFALLTLAVPFILAAIARLSQQIDGGQGTTLPTPTFPDWVGDFQHLMFLLNLAVATIAVAVALAVQNSRLGRGLSAIHDSEDAAEVLGVPTFRYKMLAIVAGGVIGGMSGSLFAMTQGYVVVESVFNLSFPLLVILICVLGGRRHWAGPLLGAAFLVVLQDWMTSSDLGKWRDIVLGVLLACMVVLAPEGLFDRVRVRPWLPVGAFLVVAVALLASGYYAEVDAMLYGMLVAFALSIVDVKFGLVPRLLRRAPAPSTAGAGGYTSEAPGTVEKPESPAVPLATVPAQQERPTAKAAGRTLVSVSGVTRDFGGVRALDDVSLTVHKGEIVGLVGPNGSGKTTMVNLLCGAMAPTAGNIVIDGRTINGLAPHRVAHTGVARTYQVPRPFASMTVRDNVAMAVMFGRSGASLRQAREQAERHLATVHLGHLADALPGALNLHQRQLLEMARAIAAEPVVLLLDEALAGLNPAEIDDAVAVIRRIHATGISIIIVEHLLRVLNQLATRIVVLNRGVLIADGEPSTVLRDPTVVHAYLGRQRA